MYEFLCTEEPFRRGHTLGKLFKLILNTVLLLIILSVIYVVCLMFRVLPSALTPQQIFKGNYIHFKQNLEKDVSAKDSTSGLSKFTLDLLNKIEDVYSKPEPAPAPEMHEPAQTTPMQHTEPANSATEGNAANAQTAEQQAQTPATPAQPTATKAQ